MCREEHCVFFDMFLRDRHSLFMVPMFCPGGCGAFVGLTVLSKSWRNRFVPCDGLATCSIATREDACDMFHSVEAAMMRARGTEMFCPRIATKTSFLKRQMSHELLLHQCNLIRLGSKLCAAKRWSRKNAPKASASKKCNIFMPTTLSMEILYTAVGFKLKNGRI